MSRRAFKLVARLYPRPWRARYGDELHDLCEELLDAGQTTRLRLASAILAGAMAERARRLRSTCGRAMAVCSVVLIIGFSTATLATNGLPLVTGQEAGRAADIGASALALGPLPNFVWAEGTPRPLRASEIPVASWSGEGLSRNLDSSPGHSRFCKRGFLSRTGSAEKSTPSAVSGAQRQHERAPPVRRSHYCTEAFLWWPNAIFCLPTLARKGRLVAEKPSDVAAETGVPGQTLWSTNEVKGPVNGEWTLAATGPADD